MRRRRVPRLNIHVRGVRGVRGIRCCIVKSLSRFSICVSRYDAMPVQHDIRPRDGVPRLSADEYLKERAITVGGPMTIINEMHRTVRRDRDCRNEREERKGKEEDNRWAGEYCLSRRTRPHFCRRVRHVASILRRGRRCGGMDGLHLVAVLYGGCRCARRGEHRHDMKMHGGQGHDELMHDEREREHKRDALPHPEILESLRVYCSRRVSLHCLIPCTSRAIAHCSPSG